jgi:hypothetical protein
VTPTYSIDRAVLLNHYPNKTASTLAEVRSAVALWAISGDATFQRRAALNSDESWAEFTRSCIVPGSTTNQIDLEALLKKCYQVAYTMPSSPMIQARLISPKNSADVGNDVEPESLVI